MKTREQTAKWMRAGLGACLASSTFIWGCDASLGLSSTEGGQGKSDGTSQEGEGEEEGVNNTDSPHPIDHRYSPLSQITNGEYVAALSHLLGVPVATIKGNFFTNTLPAEAKSLGLVNASNRQAVTQLAITGYAGLSTAIADEFIKGANHATFLERLGCAELGATRGVAAGSYSPEMCLRDFGEQLLRRGFRGAFEDDDVARLDELMKGLDAPLAQVEPPANAASLSEALVLRFEAVVQLVALSPKFVLMIERGEVKPDGEARPLTAREIANRLAFFLTGGPPDDALLAKAAAGDLNGPEGRVAAVEALLASPESATGAVDILVRWLGVDAASDATDAASIAQLRTFLESWVTEQRPFQDFYSAPFPVQLTDGLESEEAFGVLGSRAVVASNTSAPTPSFINRGEFITERLLCAQLPEDLPDAALEGDPRTPLEVFEVHAVSPCATCHHVFDNYGAALQRFNLDTSLYDPAAEELGSSFELSPIGDISGKVSNPAELGAVLGASSQAQLCLAKLWYRHAIRRDLLSNEVDNEHVSKLVESWSTSGDSSLRSLLRVIVADEDFARLLP